MLRAIDLRVLVGDENHALGRDAALVVGHAQRLAVGSLRLLDGHADGHAYVDVQLLAGGIFQVQQGTLPDGVAAVQFSCSLDSLVHVLLVIHVDGGLKEERLGHGVLLRAAVALKLIVVCAAEGQLLLQLVVALTYGGYHVLEPRIADGLVVDREWLGADAPLIAILIWIISYDMIVHCQKKILNYLHPPPTPNS